MLHKDLKNEAELEIIYLDLKIPGYASNSIKPPINKHVPAKIYG